MNHEDHVRLIRDGIVGGGSIWADLGSGGGAFTLALADLLGLGGHIYSVDTDARALREQRQALQARFPAVTLEQRIADFTRPLDLPPLDGVVMANSLHFQRHKEPVLRLVRGMLKPGGRLVLVEYNADRGNPWVPYPLSYLTWAALARTNGFVETRLLATVPSRFLREIYSALSRVPS
ncbi:MAG TPA: class I SAM-dependent methyltransferase [Ktedonobacterales bacterium]